MNARTLVVSLACLALTPAANAVSLSQNGAGQALLYPYYTVQGENNTLFSIANPWYGRLGQFKAVKVRFREHRNGRPVADFNLYLAPGMVFTGMVTRNPEGRPILVTQSPACTVPRFAPSTAMPGWTELPFSNAAYAGYDRAGSGIERAREGYFEAIEMGKVYEGFALPNGKSLWTALQYAGPNLIVDSQDCGAVAAAWATGGAFRTSGGAELLPPAGGLFGMGTIINVPQGTDYSFDPVALDGFSTLPHHTAPGDMSPNLGDADPVSLVTVGNVAHVSTWNNGRDAVSATLARAKVLNEYIDKTPQLDAATDIILTFPTKGLHVVRESDGGQFTSPPFSAEFDDLLPAGQGASGDPLADGTSRGACEPIYMNRYAPDGRQNSVAGGLNFPGPFPIDPRSACWATSVFSFGNVLDAQSRTDISQYFATPYGWIGIEFPSPPAILTSREGHRHVGLTVIGFAIEKYVNGNLNGVLSNYGGTLAHKYFTVVE